MNAPLPAFQQFQMAFGRRCRDPRAARPADVPARRMAVYEELLFNNITGFLDACFPVCRKLLGDTRWRRLNRAFFRDWRSHTPIFREIPQEFLRYLDSTRQPLPAWFRELAHYEWVELAVDTNSASCPPHDPDGDLIHDRPLVNVTLMSLAYDWPVHRIGPDFRPRQPTPTWLLVFRDEADVVRFVETNAATARLLALIVERDCTGAEAVEHLAMELDEKSAMAVRLHGPTILDDLRRQGAILGVRK
jgi:uncharacterized protein